MQTPGQQKFNTFRDGFPFFSYDSFETTITSEGFKVVFHFNLSDKYYFHPCFSFPIKSVLKKRPDESWINSPGIQSLLFHIGMIELISYWKAACPPIVKVKGFKLDKDQVAWWKKVYYHGLGEFFYTNGIRTSMDEFMKIESDGNEIRKEHYELSDKVLVPIGGGKDSVVTLELLRQEFEIRPFILNPRGASLETSYKAGFSNNMVAEIKRTLDPQLLKLNEQGFLNGHTPFSALLAFYTLLVAALTGYKHIALSNESSANEPTVAGTDVNHQYSKSFSFEKDFRDYVSRYISEDFNYFSFLRPLSELQIGMLFSKHVKYYPVFKSCNAGSKTDTWCCQCPKCLFAWIILSPFIPVDELTHIFGKNLFEDARLIRYLKELTGIDEVKPFECVGTVDEVNMALELFIQQHEKEKWPVLIDYYSNTSNFNMYKNGDSESIRDAGTIPELFLHNLNNEHFLEERFLNLIKKAIG
jgi:UDP-N-acetyl-alpha-D-muramoyl-L-alanyl-L-glutamate epimerase